MASKSDEPDGATTSKIHRKPIGFDVDTNCRWFADMAAVEMTTLRLTAGWLSRTPWLETKCHLAQHMAEDAEAADLLRKRMPGLRATSEQIEQCSQRAAAALMGLDDAPDALHYLAAMYSVVKPLLLQTFREHLEKTDQLADAPSGRALRVVMDDLRRQIAWGKKTLKAFSARSEANEKALMVADAWGRDFGRRIRAGGGLPGRIVPADGRLFARKPQYEPLLDDRFTVVPQGEPLPDRRPRNRVEKVWKYMHGRMMGELQCVEVFARNIYEFPESPFDYHLGLARCAWDEARHTLMFSQELERIGGRLGEWPVQFSVYHHVNAGVTPLERAVLFNCFAENRGMDGISDDRWFFEDMDQLVPALHRDYELADEVDHVRLGNRWAQRFTHGDEEELWSVVQSLQDRGLLPPDATVDGAEIPALAVIRPAERPEKAPVDLRCKQLAECSPRQVEYFLKFAGGSVADTRRALRVMPR